MAVKEMSGFLKYTDDNGDLNLLFPITTKDNVDGLDDIENEIATIGEQLTTLQNNYDENIIGLSIDGQTITYIKGDGSVHTLNITLSAGDVGADASGAANTALTNAKAYTDEVVAQKSQVQIVTWEADD